MHPALYFILFSIPDVCITKQDADKAITTLIPFCYPDFVQYDSEILKYAMMLKQVIIKPL